MTLIEHHHQFLSLSTIQRVSIIKRIISDFVTNRNRKEFHTHLINLTDFTLKVLNDTANIVLNGGHKHCEKCKDGKLSNIEKK